MFIAMNRFKIVLGKEEEFIDVWRQRDSYLEDVLGFQSFNLLQGQSNEEYTLFASHTIWASRDDFENWTQSEAFRKAHAQAGNNRDLYLGPPQLEFFDSVL